MEGQTTRRLDNVKERNVREGILDVSQRALDITIRSANVFLDVRLLFVEKSRVVNRSEDERRVWSIARPWLADHL